MTSFSDIIADEATSHSIDLVRLDNGIANQILGQLKMLEEDLISQINTLEMGDGEGMMSVRYERLTGMMDEVSRSVQKYYKENKMILGNDLIELSEIESKYAAKEVNDFLKVELMSTVPLQIHKAIARDLLIDGSPAKEWWKRQANATRQRFNDQMTVGVLQGETNSQLVQRIRGTATGKFVTYNIDGKSKKFREFDGGIMSVSTREARALVRTAVQNVSNAARMETYKDNADVVSKVQALASLDSRTTLICQARSGLVWTLEGQPVGHDEPFPGPPPWHYNCRSTLIPITKTFEELRQDGNRKIKKKISEIPKSTQASMDGQVAGNLNYNSWLKTKPKAFQKQVLGKGRYELYESGKLNLKDLIDHQTSRPLTVAELKLKLEPGAPKISPRPVKGAQKPMGKFAAPGDNVKARVDNVVGHQGTKDLKKAMPDFSLSQDAMAVHPPRKALTDAIKEEIKSDKDLKKFMSAIMHEVDNYPNNLEDTVSGIMNAWQGSSTGRIGSILQQAVKQEFNLAKSVTAHMEPFQTWKSAAKLMEDASFAKGARRFVRMMYNSTQSHLKSLGIKDVYVFRGTTYKRLPTDLREGADAAGGIVGREAVFSHEAATQPLSSWTVDSRISLKFSDVDDAYGTGDMGTAVMYASKVPASRVFATASDHLSGLVKESETMILGGKDTVTAIVSNDNFMKDYVDKLYKKGEWNAHEFNPTKYEQVFEREMLTRLLSGGDG